MRKLILNAATAVIMIVGLASCRKSETVILTYENLVAESLEQSDSSQVRISDSIEYLESFEGGKAVMKKINNAITVFCFGPENDGKSLEEASEETAEVLVSEYRREAEEHIASYWYFNWSYITEGRFAGSYNDLQTYSVYTDTYLGGAHGMQALIPHVINLRKGDVIEETDLFLPGYEEPVSALIKQTLQNEWGSPDDPDSPYNSMEEDGMVPNGAFAVSELGVTWYYQPYVIASYAQGIIEALVTWEDLKPYVNSDLLKLF